MITKITPQEAKPSVLFNLTGNFNVGTPNPAETIFKRKYDFSKIDYLSYFARTQLTGGDTGAAVIKLYVADNLVNTLTAETTTQASTYELIDCTSVTGIQLVEITIFQNGGNDMLINEIYLGTVDK